MATTAVHLRATAEAPVTETGCHGRDQGFYDSFDGTYSEVNGLIYLTLYVEGDPLSATREAIERVENELSIRILEIERDLVTLSDIAERVGRSREGIRLLAEGKRGSGGFPVPVASPGGVRVWDWADVNEWLRGNVGLGDPESGLARSAFFALNYWLLSRFGTASGAAS
jgi:hypothetical protein